MPAPGRTVYIAGAGIAGLTLALGLAKFGVRVVVLERGSSIPEQGSGVQLSPNARRALNNLGLDRQIAERSFEPAGIDVYPFRARRPLATLPLGPAATERYGAPYAVIHRADLADILFRACRRFANIDIAFDVSGLDVVSHERGVSINADEPSGRSREARAFAFVGADGVNSTIRTGVLGGRGAVQSGYVAWRTMLPLAALGKTLAADRTSLLLAPGCHVVCYPLPQREQVNVVLIRKESAGTPVPADPELPRSPQFAAIAEAGRDGWTYWPIATVETPNWHDGAVGLIGDAAHAMLPFQAQGAAMAIEDAAMLAPLLMTEPSAESAFRRFAAMRQERVQRVARLSRFNGWAFHLRWPSTLARDAVLRLRGPRHLARLDWLYGFNAAPEVNTTIPLVAREQ